jgi:hypothetical protein
MESCCKALGKVPSSRSLSTNTSALLPLASLAKEGECKCHCCCSCCRCYCSCCSAAKFYFLRQLILLLFLQRTGGARRGQPSINQMNRALELESSEAPIDSRLASPARLPCMAVQWIGQYMSQGNQLAQDWVIFRGSATYKYNYNHNHNHNHNHNPNYLHTSLSPAGCHQSLAACEPTSTRYLLLLLECLSALNRSKRQPIDSRLEAGQGWTLKALLRP